jgi:hypothetical protein
MIGLLTIEDCFRDVLNKDKDTIKVPPFPNLASATTALAFRRVMMATQSPTLETLGLLLVPPILIPCFASNSHAAPSKNLAMPAPSNSRTRNSFAMRTWQSQRISTVAHWSSSCGGWQKGCQREDYWIVVTLLADQRPRSIAKWYDSAISEALATDGTQPRTGQADPTVFSDALVWTWGCSRRPWMQ